MSGGAYFVDLLNSSGAVDHLLEFMFVDEVVGHNEGEERGCFASARRHLQNTMALQERGMGVAIISRDTRVIFPLLRDVPWHPEFS